MAMTNTTRKKKNKFYMIVIVILIMTLGGVIYLALNKDKIKVFNNDEQDYHTVIYNDEKYNYNTSIVSILLLGIDSKTEDELGQADAIEMLLLDRNNKEIKMISIPRDTMTEIRVFDMAGNDLGWKRQHLNLAYPFANNPKSGCMYTAQAVSHLFNDIPMTRYAALKLDLLVEVHNIVGSVELEVPNDTLVDTELGWKQGDIVTITSDNVEQYLRTRDTDVDFSNVTRMERQKAYLLAYFNTLRENLNKDFDKTVSRMYNVLSAVTTNISLSEMEDFAHMVLEYSFDANDGFYTLEGEDVAGTLHDEFEVNQTLLDQIIIEWFYEKEE